MRDELLCQLSNQTWQNDNEANRQRGWLLMANCLGCFAPSPLLYKYLLKYVSDHGDKDGYAGHCQQQLLRSQGRDARTYPPSMLEWQANAKKCRMALPAAFHDGGLIASVHNDMTVYGVLRCGRPKRPVYECYCRYHCLSTTYGLCGADYVLDLISEAELPPAFPVCKAYFLVSHDPRGAAPVPETPHHPSRVNTYEVDPADVATPPPAPPVRVSSRKAPSRSREPIPVPPPVVPAAAAAAVGVAGRMDGVRSRRSIESQPRNSGTDGSLDRRDSRLGGRSVASSSHARSRSMEDLLDEGPPDSALSKRSALNGRYFEMARAESAATSAGGGQQRCVATVHHRPDLDDAGGIAAATTPSGRSHHDDVDDDDDDGGTSWGLSASVLNERYFSRSTGGSMVPPSASETASELMLDSPLNGRPGSDRSESPQVDARSGTTDATRYVKYSGGFSRASRTTQGSSLPHGQGAVGRSCGGRSRGGWVVIGVRPELGASRTRPRPRQLASHVRNVRIPSHTSDLDQYLDDLFNPVLLDGGLDELSDARSLAASLRGTTRRGTPTTTA
ncbi:hypothetical protein HPB50_010767 [Hyalomma asiaticum]|uniref:Uncharacterized protein n=1 Tax=Hyalomma asiaticum TaxID=266040 RepID=A0ACB7T7A6_HYAAI|nr:hypothetical protein HPB50_010767 [Hyalomma asiaticum]